MFSQVVRLAMIFLVCTGMKLMLQDGNFIEVERYQVLGNSVIFKASGRSYSLPEELVDTLNTERLVTQERRRSTRFGIYSSYSPRSQQDRDWPLNGMIPIPIKLEDLEPFKVKVEPHRPDPPFMQEMLPVNRDENVGNKAENRGFMLKFELPLDK